MAVRILNISVDSTAIANIMLRCLAPAMLILATAASAVGQAGGDKDMCYFSAKDALKSGILVRESPDAQTNEAIFEERRVLLHTFHLFPSFYYIVGDGDSNAYATREIFNGKEDGTIALGLALIQAEIRSNGGRENALSIPAIIAHEFGHLLQFKFGTMATGALAEIQADFLAGWYLGRRVKGEKLTSAALGSVMRSFYEKGDYAFNQPTHHGTPEERSRAIQRGYSYSTLKLNDAYEVSVQFVGLPKPNPEGPMSFAIDDGFKEILRGVLAKRDSGFVALKGDLVPGLTASWGAKIRLPGSLDCSIVWRNEYQGEYDCIMVETLERDIATNEWQKLVAELQTSDWETKIASTSGKEFERSATVRIGDDQDFSVSLSDKTAVSGYQITISISFDNY